MAEGMQVMGPGDMPQDPREAVAALSVEERDALAGVLGAYRCLKSGAFRRYLAINPRGKAVLSKLLNPVIKEGWRRGLEEARRWLRSQTLESDIWLIVGDEELNGAAAEERLAAARRIGARVSRYFADPAARARITEEKSLRGSVGVKQWLLDKVFPEAVLKVLSSVDHPRKGIRLSKGWLDGRREYVKPSERWAAEERNFARWLMQEIKNAAEAILLERSYPPPTSTECRGRGLSPRLSHNLGVWLEQQSAALSPRQRELLEHIRAGIPRNKLPALLNVRSPTVRTMLHQIKLKLQRA